VWIKDKAYNPATITVTTETAIKRINKDAIVYTVASDAGLFDSGSMFNGVTFSHTFNTPGTFQYYCTVHPTMTGKVIVN
jgi:plastocyanin